MVYLVDGSVSFEFMAKTILYFHRDDVSSREFYNGTKSKNNAKGEINLRNIVGVREASKRPTTRE